MSSRLSKISKIINSNGDERQVIIQQFLYPIPESQSEIETTNEVKVETEPKVRPKVRNNERICFCKPEVLSGGQPSSEPSFGPKAEHKFDIFVDSEGSDECVRSPAMNNSKNRFSDMDRPFRPPNTSHNLRVVRKHRLSLDSVESIIKDINGNDLVGKDDNKVEDNDLFNKKCEQKLIKDKEIESLVENKPKAKPLMNPLDEIRVKNPNIDFNRGLRRPLRQNIQTNDSIPSVTVPSVSVPSVSVPSESVPCLRKPKHRVNHFISQLLK